MTTGTDEALATALAALVAAVRAPAAPTVERRLLTVAEAAEQLRVGRTMIYAMLRDGRINGVKIGRRRLVPASEIERIING